MDFKAEGTTDYISESEEDPGDLTKLSILHENHILAYLEKRYKKDAIYTWAGPTLVSVNPFKELQGINNLSKSRLPKLRTSIAKCKEQYPHISSVAENVLGGLRDSGVSQAIVISGESGAGKTFSSNFLINHLSQRSRNQEFESIEEKICAFNPILEAFGNSSTSRNHNSSRFGKLVRIFYKSHEINGAILDTYLLEKTRVSKQNEKERNFHIFYQLLAGLIEDDLAVFSLNKSTKWKILPHQDAKSLDDKRNFEVVQESMIKVGLDIEMQLNIFKILSAILHLGQVEFSYSHEKVAVWPASKKHLAIASRILGLSEKQMEKVLTVQVITAGACRKQSVYDKPCESADQCRSRRDCLMKAVYEKLFTWIVDYMNSYLKPSEENAFIGILDVYGFESFEDNSLEQLCINYTNERLQQYFVSNFLMEQKSMLEEEGFDCVQLDGHLNRKSCISDIDSSVSVFGSLNQECQLKRSCTEAAVCQRLCDMMSSSSYVKRHSLLLDNNCFIIKHYAENVKYSTKDMVEKNKDQIPSELSTIVMISSNNFLKELFSVDEGSSLKSGRKQTTLHKFKQSVDKMMCLISSCDVHYVRCIKPNTNLLPNNFQEDYTKRQLRACGVLETVEISKAGLPIRIDFKKFLLRFGSFPLNEIPQPVASSSQSFGQSQERITILKLFKLLPSFYSRDRDYVVGKSRVFLSQEVLDVFKSLVMIKRNIAAITLQNYFRHLERRKHCCIKLQSFFRMLLQRRRFHAQKKSAMIIQRWLRNVVIKPKSCVADNVSPPLNAIENAQFITKRKRRRVTPTENCSESKRAHSWKGKKLDYIKRKDGLATVRRIPNIKIKFHTKKTCIADSHCLPISEIVQGLGDLLD